MKATTQCYFTLIVATSLHRLVDLEWTVGVFYPPPGKKQNMPLFEVETSAHIVITWAEDAAEAQRKTHEAYPSEQVKRVTKRPRDTWVISKAVLGISSELDPNSTARDCLSKAAGDKVHAIRLYMQETGADLDGARKAIETNMVIGW